MGWYSQILYKQIRHFPGKSSLNGLVFIDIIQANTTFPGKKFSEWAGILRYYSYEQQVNFKKANHENVIREVLTQQVSVSFVKKKKLQEGNAYAVKL